MRRSHSESSLFKKQKKSDDKGKEKAKNTAAVSVATTTPVELSLFTLPPYVWAELLTRIPVLTELLATRVNRQLRNSIEDLIKREYLKPATALAEILADPEIIDDLTIKNGLVDGSAAATFLKVPAARIDRLIACDRIGRLYLFDQEIYAPRTQSSPVDDRPLITLNEETLNRIARGFMGVNVFSIIEVVMSRLKSVDSRLTPQQRAFLMSDLVILKIARGNLDFDTAIHCWHPEEIHRLGIDLNSETTVHCLHAGLTPQEILDLEAHNPSLSISEDEIATLYSFANIDLATLNLLDTNTRDFILHFDTMRTIKTIINDNCNIDFQEVIALDIHKLKAILENDNLISLLKFGVPFAELAILDNDKLKAICTKMGRVYDTLNSKSVYFFCHTPRSTSPGSLPIIHLDKLLLILDYAEKLSPWLNDNVPIDKIAQLDKITITAMADNNRIIGAINKQCYDKKFNLNTEQIFTVLINKKIPLTELFKFNDKEVSKLFNGLTVESLNKICEIAVTKHIPFSQLGKLSREQLDIICRAPKTEPVVQKILADLRSAAKVEPSVSKAPTRRGSM